MVRCIIASAGREYQFWLIFKIKLIQCKLPVYILNILFKVVIWNGAAKQVLDSSDSWMSWMEAHGVGKSLARTSKVEWKGWGCE